MHTTFHPTQVPFKTFSIEKDRQRQKEYYLRLHEYYKSLLKECPYKTSGTGYAIPSRQLSCGVFSVLLLGENGEYTVFFLGYLVREAVTRIGIRNAKPPT